MTAQLLLTVQAVFLLLGNGLAGDPAVLGVVVEAHRARLGSSEVSPGSTVYDGDSFTTAEQGTLRLQCQGALLELWEKSSVIVRHTGNAAQGAKAELVEGTLMFSKPQASEIEIEARNARIHPAGTGRAVGQVTILGPKELLIYARRGVAEFSYRGESKTIAEGESYHVILDPAEDGPGDGKSPPRAGRPRKGFLLVAVSTGVAVAGVLAYEKRGHERKKMESPDRP